MLRTDLAPGKDLGSISLQPLPVLCFPPFWSILAYLLKHSGDTTVSRKPSRAFSAVTGPAVFHSCVRVSLTLEGRSHLDSGHPCPWCWRWHPSGLQFGTCSGKEQVMSLASSRVSPGGCAKAGPQSLMPLKTSVCRLFCSHGGVERVCAP